MNVVFTRQNPDGGTDRTSPHFQSRPVVQLNHINTMDHIEEAITRLNTLVEIYTDQGSGWIIEEIRNVSLNLAAYDNIGGSSYFKSPEWLDNIGAHGRVSRPVHYLTVAATLDKSLTSHCL